MRKFRSLHRGNRDQVHFRVLRSSDRGAVPDKDEIARMLADAHRKSEPTSARIIRLLDDREDDVREPVKLLEVTPARDGAWATPSTPSRPPSRRARVDPPDAHRRGWLHVLEDAQDS